MIRSAQSPSPGCVGQHYDEIDHYYRKLWGEHLHHGLWNRRRDSVEQATRNLLDFLTENVPIRTGDSVCDIGCGYGGTARYLALSRDCRVTGYTVSSIQHGIATAQTPSHFPCTFLLKDWLSAEIVSDKYDACLAIESTEHIKDKSGLFRRAATSLKKSGRLGVCAWLARSEPSPASVRHLLEPICREGRLVGLPSEWEFHEWLQDAGLRRIRAYDLSARVRRTWSICAGRLLRELVHPASWRFLSDRRNANRSFALTVFRILIAYRTGALRYLVFTARK